MNKFFKNLDLNNYDQESLSLLLNEDKKTSQVILTFRYTPKCKAVFYKLHLKVNEKTEDLLNDNAIKDSDGNITFQIGEFSDETSIEISFGVFAVTKIPKIIAIVSQNYPTVVFQAEPKNTGETHTIKVGERWEKTIKFTIE